MQAVQKVTGKARTFVLAFVLALSAIGISTVAQPGSVLAPQSASAAVYGQPGCIGDYKFKYTGREWYTGLKVFKETCDYRTATGAIINDSYTGYVWKTW